MRSSTRSLSLTITLLEALFLAGCGSEPNQNGADARPSGGGGGSGSRPDGSLGSGNDTGTGPFTHSDGSLDVPLGVPGDAGGSSTDGADKSLDVAIGTTADAGGSPSTDAAKPFDASVFGDAGGSALTCPHNGRPQKLFGAALNSIAVLTQDETWTPDNLYIVLGHLSTGPHRLTLQPGTVVCFGDDQIKPTEQIHGMLNVSEGGSLIVAGTAERRVLLTSLDNPDLFWGGIRGDGAYKEIEIAYADIAKAGASADPGAISTLRGPQYPALKLRHVGLHQLQSKGLKLLTHQGLSSDSVDVVVHSYLNKTEDPLYLQPVLTVDPNAISSLTKDKFNADPAVPTYARVVFVDSPGVLADSVWRNINGMPYRTIELKIPDPAYDGKPLSFTIEAGVTVQMETAGIWYIGQASAYAVPVSVTVKGTEQEPVVFTGAIPGSQRTPSPGAWGSLFFRTGSFDAKKTSIEHARFDYGGATPHDVIYHCRDNRSDVGAPVLIDRPTSSGPYSGPAIRNSTFSNSAGQAIRGFSGASVYLGTNYLDPILGNQMIGFTSAPQLAVGCP